MKKKVNRKMMKNIFNKVFSTLNRIPDFSSTYTVRNLDDINNILKFPLDIYYYDEREGYTREFLMDYGQTHIDYLGKTEKDVVCWFIDYFIKQEAYDDYALKHKKPNDLRYISDDSYFQLAKERIAYCHQCIEKGEETL
ncbi:MAG: hypothetical protein IJR02_11275 [Bacteroidaceae bacterium]|nr:hypothetical protein [Bacteroidaceae bacterium]